MNAYTSHTLYSQRLELRPVTPEIVHQLFTSNNGESAVKAYFQVDNIGYEHLKVRYEQGMQAYRISQFYFLLCDRNNDEILGECGFHTWNTHHHRAEVFYSIRSEHQKNKGYMSEALQEVLAFGFQTLQLHRVQALVAKDNVPSLKLLDKFNFRKEGTARQDYRVNDTFEDSEVYSLLRTEWRSN